MKNELIPNPSLVLEKGTAPFTSNTPSLSLEKGQGGEFTYRDSSEMKDSGVEWIGMIPKGWDFYKIKLSCSKITDGSHFSPEAKDEGKFYVTVKDVNKGKVNFENCTKISQNDFDELIRSGCKPEIGDVLLSKDGTIGRVAVVCDNDFVILSSLAILRPIYKFHNSKYLSYWLESPLNIDQMKSFIAGAALTRLTLQSIKKLYGVFPPLTEQIAIANFLDRKTAEFDNIIAKKEKIITKLEEAKKSLISELVTGKSELIPNPSLVLEKGTAPSASNTPSLSLERGLGGIGE